MQRNLNYRETPDKVVIFARPDGSKAPKADITLRHDDYREAQEGHIWLKMSDLRDEGFVGILSAVVEAALSSGVGLKGTGGQAELVAGRLYDN